MGMVEWVWDLYGMGGLLKVADLKRGPNFDEQEMERLMIVGLWNAPYFSIEVHHGGTFALRPTKVYVGGKVQTVHGLDTKYISLLQLEAMAQQLGYDSFVTFYYTIPGYNLDVGLLPINNDQRVLSMLKNMDHKRTVVTYLEQVGGVGSSSIKAHDIDSIMPLNSQLGSSNLPIDIEVDDDDFDVMPTVVGDGKIDVHVDDSGVGDKICDSTEVPEEGVENDSSTDDNMYYSDHSYMEQDDDDLYETYVDDDVEFVGVRESAEEEEYQFGEDGNDIILSVDDSKYDSDNSYYTSSDEENFHRRKHHFKQFRSETDMEDPQFKVGMLFSTP
ncbi:hypothetical protein Vadar_016328 [Vaccinium darrowii]|uniref:Uncharacterized protein n=1 Tax=Vaccinium darrowii TaxID=229202 RepID=A0ACB7XZE0_9ERIC|nr:hypothetical protein Vadar_016328 [Vaccinium darrowii]